MIAPVLLSAVPLLAVIALLALGRGAVTSSLVGLGLAVVLGLTVFPVDAGTLTVEGLDFLPVVVEVTLILLTGVVLARLLGALGAMTRISDWVLAASPGPTAGAVLIVFGIVPFAESVTGFGIGITVGIPILVHLGFGIRKASVLGLLGMVAAPWGGLAPGAKVASGLLGIPLTELGVATAHYNVLPVCVVAAVLTFAVRDRLTGLLYSLIAGVVLSIGLWGFNSLIGTPLAGVLATLLVVAVLLLVFRIGGARATFDRELALALVPYGVLTVGLLVCSALAALWPHPITTLLTSPPVWLAAGCLAAVVRLLSRGPGTGATLREGVRAWVPVGVATASFMVMGWSLSVFEMSTRIGEALSAFGVWTVPALGMVGSILAGSITGSLSMFATTFGSIASITDTPVLEVVAAGMASSGLANGASPARAALAVTMAFSALPRTATAPEAADASASSGDPDESGDPDDTAASESIPAGVPADALLTRESLERSVLLWTVVLSAISAAAVAIALTLTV